MVEDTITQEREIVHLGRGLPLVVKKRRTKTARTVAPQAAPPVVRFSELFGLGEVTYSVVLTDQELRITVQGRDLTILAVQAWGAAELALDVVRAGKLWEHPTLGTLLVLVGAWRGSWQVSRARVLVTGPVRTTLSAHSCCCFLAQMHRCTALHSTAPFTLRPSGTAFTRCFLLLLCL